MKGDFIMKTTLCMNCINVTCDSKLDDFVDECFMVKDIAGIILEHGLEATIVNINFYCGEQKEKTEMLKKICSGMCSADNSRKIVICTSAFVSTVEFPSNKWYDPHVPQTNESTKGRKVIPFDYVLGRESAMLEEIGFVNINGFVGYKSRRAFLYSNDLGKEILSYSKI